MELSNLCSCLKDSIIATTLFALLTLAGVVNASVPMIVDDSLVSFSPAIMLETGSECFGARIAKPLVATSPLCGQAIHKESENTAIKILDTEGKTIGNVIPAKGSLTLNPLDQNMLLDISAALGNEFDTYPVLRDSNTPPDTAYAFFKGKNGSIVQEPVVLTQLSSSKGQRHFDIASTTTLPPGALVMDDHNNLVCLMSVKNQCLSVPLGQTFISRELNQYDGESSADTAALYMPQIIIASAVAVVATGAIGTFYLVTFVRSRQLGIPAGLFWKNICNLGYCSGWSGLSSIQCALGFGCVPFTYGYSAACCWTAPLTAAWNWIDMTARNLAGSDSAQLIPPPEYSLAPNEAVINMEK